MIMNGATDVGQEVPARICSVQLKSTPYAHGLK